MDERLKRELAIIQAYEIRYGTDEFLVMDALMERKGYCGNWSADVVGDDNWADIEKMAHEICGIVDGFIDHNKVLIS